MAKPDPIVLMTRPRAQSDGLVQQLQAAGARFRPVFSPLIGITVTGPLPPQDDLAGLIFTSANGVDAWIALGGRVDLPAFAVGKATAEKAKAAGITAQSADGNAQTLIDMIDARRPKAPLLHVCGAHSRGDVAAALTARGIATRAAILYDQPALPLTTQACDALAGEIPVIAPLFSPRTAALLAKQPVKAPLLVAGISQAVVNAVQPLHIWKSKIAKRPESDAMLAAVLELLEVAGESVKN
ncbi:uroporphyrinogen-III synthase [Tropicibacter oceani]|uniref:Uroporphyrinogen-III synthase n=1 Tax=Tropicibacter oceani TaxID=3058420 RepID=A0ABY8QL50_9RHOB|nr:uroporphyrinogen-III synthase [Tropicibacter oceani]WGW04542.1 uroporphyrinogen-III synthase [Tropicibacter oceani]